MKYGLVKFAVVAAVVAFSARALAQGPPRGAEAPLTNGSVVKLVRAGFSEKAVIAIIRARPANFDLAPERLIELKKSGVGEKVILAMIGRGGADDLANDDWGDDMPLGDVGATGQSRGGAKEQSPGADAGSTDIFGSSGGSKGRVRSRGGSGGADNDTQTTGSATVRIIRPPAEGGGDTQAKLERTPTLTDDSVVELVEAGFSEGTIIRRIEQSPVEFDLSPAKLSELRKRRVSEPVIAAMRAAMGEDGGQGARPEK
ncbi:MAG: hypothetical protein DMF67_07265 [Acidobacteria bacterium]|nr:MAG: hypothetical protein DMF66_19395 [Acidobacteriota bacterium]PYS83852.1 MAG: hypothetical protein DMF67_07265 [Acidobacteriota bacterium]